MQQKTLFADVKVILHKRVLLVFVYTADIRFICSKHSRLGGFASGGNHNGPVCTRAEISQYGCLVVFCLSYIASFLSGFIL